MYISAARLNLLSDICTKLTSEGTREELLNNILHPIAEFLKADYLVSRNWQQDSAHVFLASYNASNEHLQAYEEFFQYCDPITPQLKALRSPTRLSSVISYTEFEKTEFYNDFLKPQKIHWGINFYMHEINDCIGDLLIYRKKEKSDFSTEDLACLNIFAPSLSSVLRRKKVDNLSRRFLDVFGSFVELKNRLMLVFKLSSREADVVSLCLQGAPDKLIARQLQIEFTTVRFHLKNAFQKMEIKKRNELTRSIAKVIL